MDRSMTKVLVVVALGTVLASQAFAQQAPSDAQTPRQEWSSRVRVYAPDRYTDWHGNQSVNPDFQLGYSR